MITDHRKISIAELAETEKSQKKWLQFKKHHVNQLRTKTVLLELQQLGFHGLGYFSPLKACFSFEMGNLDVITHLSPILFRDGLLGLCEFFQKNPHPQPHTLILVHKNLVYAIPRAWKDNCFAYQYLSRNTPSQDTASTLIVGSSGFGPKQGSQHSLDFLCSIVEKLNFSFDQVWLTNFPTFPKENLKKDIELQNEQIGIGLQLASYFRSKVLVKTPYQIEKEKINKSLFWDLNFYQFYYSDSFFYQSLIANGSKPLTLENIGTEEIISEVDMSFNHKLTIYKIDETQIGRIESDLNLLKNSSLFTQPPPSDEAKDTLPVKPIAEIAFNLAKQIKATKS